MLANDHANVTLSSLVYDPVENNLLVAALIVTTAIELLAVIKAQLEQYGKNACRAIDLAGDKTIQLRGASFGYATMKSSLRTRSATRVGWPSSFSTKS